MILTEKTEELREKLVPVPSVHQKSHMDWPGPTKSTWTDLGMNPGLSGVTNRLSYSTILSFIVKHCYREHSNSVILLLTMSQN
jgi:hypothetical protein